MSSEGFEGVVGGERGGFDWVKMDLIISAFILKRS